MPRGRMDNPRRFCFPSLAVPASQLSGGEQQMLALARGLMARPRLLLVDEPSLGLAPLLVRALMEVVDRLRDDGVSVLLVEQDVGVALGHADRGYVLETGRIVLADAAQALLENAAVRKAYLGIREETGHPGGSVLLTAADARPCDRFR